LCWRVGFSILFLNRDIRGGWDSAWSHFALMRVFFGTLCLSVGKYSKAQMFSPRNKKYCTVREHWCIVGSCDLLNLVTRNPFMN
jgi:hypothetical protein